jgi:hypothetical protein
VGTDLFHPPIYVDGTVFGVVAAVSVMAGILAAVPILSGIRRLGSENA